jgi:hypothetical protein
VVNALNFLRRTTVQLVALSLLSACSASQITRITRAPEPQITGDGSAIFINVRLTLAYVQKVIAKLQADPTIKRVHFNNCPGGDYEASKQLARFIRDGAFTTQAESAVSSGCHLAYMAGTTRLLARSGSVSFSVHAPYRRFEQSTLPESIFAEFIALFARYSDGQFPGGYEWAIGGYRRGEPGVIFTSFTTGGKTSQFVRMCDIPTEDTGASHNCSESKPVSFRELGLTTQ